MRTGLRKRVWIGCGLLALSLVLLSPKVLRVEAADVLVGPPATRTATVVVHICGNGVFEMGEECDPGRHCVDYSTDCTANPAVCALIGNGSCNVVSFGSCSDQCTVIVGGSKPPVVTQVTLTTITVRPEQRYLGGGNNYDTDFYFSLLNSDNASHQIPVYQSTMFTATASGDAYPYVTFPDSVSAGTYDALIKTKAHLAKLQDNAYLIAGDNILNFTNPNNSAVIGSSTLIAGDIDGDGNSLSGFGDNVINSVDLSILLSKIGSSDPSGNTIRANLNQDGTVDQADLNILLGNLDKEGDK